MNAQPPDQQTLPPIKGSWEDLLRQAQQLARNFNDDAIPILRKIVLSRFASSFAMMYASGITVIDAIRSCEELMGNRPLEAAVRTAGQQIAEGKNLTAAFQDLGLFPPLVIRMLRIGENTGALDTALLNVSYFYNREVRESIGKLQAMIEPVMTVLLGAILGWVMLSVLGPVYDSISKMKF